MLGIVFCEVRPLLYFVVVTNMELFANEKGVYLSLLRIMYI